MITAVIVAAYVTSFRGALVFDDLPGIANNPTIRDLSQPGLLLVAIGPQGGTLSGRPVPNLTLALNYAISGDRLWSYHATNLLIHVAAALTLFGIVRRTLSQPVLADRFGSNAGPIAFAVALLWGVHPLQTESVTYLIQRVESLMGLFYLLTLYCFLRAVESPLTGRRWYLRAFFTCLLGMGCKEVMVTAPVVVALYDRIFVTGSWRETLRTRWKFHVALMSTWIVLGGLVVASGGRGGTAGYQVGINAWNYLLTQCKVILDYLKLSLWPFPLVFDHNVPLATGMGDVWPQAVMLCVLLGASVYLLIRRPALGFLCAAFFLILAPTSSVVPISDAKVEHRMYLPLASIVTAVVLGIHRQLGRIALPVWLGLALALGTATAIRNLDYQSPRRLWGDTVQKIPGSPRAHNNLGAYLLSDGEVDAAREHFSTALRLNPNYASAHYNLAQLLEKTGRMEEAVHSYETAIRLNPKLVDAHVNSAHLLDRLGRAAEAVSHYERALVLDPDAPDVHADLAASLLKVQQLAPAIDHLKTAVELAPDRAELWCNLARAFLQGKDFPAARRAGARALQLKPDFPEAHYVLGNLDIASNDFPNAIAHYQRASELAPDYIPARNNLANALLVSGKIDAAIAQYQIILQQRPNDASVRENLARAFELRGTSAR
ncbi:MAG: tetratricopeptide repeat protein [Opitutaceae bacterium]